ncbi:DEAD/DEAH box helicase [Reinekea marinisedimentorum]|uniref:Superfamily II DNA/RNA helicase n=1 Tax=Reinekea marinisedimentorum TaxID=230495 RepID=A0A4R3I129_9GAMM|nr:DEAD/DEAH box helicase [Reinekea marinisedimentorum]TCS38894.1 superfamily II DNA/RNA helicase [Reinekea marinisedimentorum]
MFSSSNLHPKLVQAIESLNWLEPTEVQQQSLPLALEGKDLLIHAETGSGKTGAYLIPVLHKIMSEAKPKSGTRALVMVPTRELAQQAKKDCDSLTQFSGVKSVIIRGGQEFQYQASLLRRNPEIVIATPGRMTEHLNSKTADLSDVEFVILDECDRMLDMGFRDEVLAITNHCTSKHQSLLLSATLRHKGVTAIASSLLTDPQLVKIKTEQLQSNITQQVILTDDDKHKEKLVLWLLSNETFEKAIVFTKTRASAQQLNNVLRYHKLRTASLHGEIAQDERNKVMAKFREGAVNVIVATDLAARGLDVDGVDLVINFDMAQSGDEHVHRVGRTGRAGQTGLAISLINSFDYSLMSSIERYLKLHFERRVIDSLKAKYSGPKNLKANGKPAGTKRKKSAKESTKKKIPKHASRKRKDIGKRRAPVNQPTDGGFTPIKKKKTTLPDTE